MQSSINTKATAASITGATNAKITYNSQGIVTSGTTLSPGDIYSGVNNVSGTSYSAVSGDQGKLISLTAVSSTKTVTLPSTAPAAGWWVEIQNPALGTGSRNATVNPGGLQIDGASGNITLGNSQGLRVVSDGTNYFTQRGSGGGAGGTLTQVDTGTGLTGGPITTTGTISLANSGVTAGTYTKVTVDATGRATAGTTAASTDLSDSSSLVRNNGSSYGISITGNAATAMTATTASSATSADSLKSATTTVSVSGATAPTAGQVLTATSSTVATWQTPASIAAYSSNGTPKSPAVHFVFGSGATVVSGVGGGQTSSISVSFSGSAAFTSSASYTCTVTNTTNTSAVLQVNQTSGTAFTINAPGGSGAAPISFNYVCIGN